MSFLYHVVCCCAVLFCCAAVYLCKRWKKSINMCSFGSDTSTSCSAKKPSYTRAQATRAMTPLASVHMIPSYWPGLLRSQIRQLRLSMHMCIRNYYTQSSQMMMIMMMMILHHNSPPAVSYDPSAASECIIKHVIVLCTTATYSKTNHHPYPFVVCLERHRPQSSHCIIINSITRESIHTTTALQHQQQQDEWYRLSKYNYC